MSELARESEHPILDSLEKLAGRIVVGASATMPGVLLSNEVFHNDPRYTGSVAASVVAAYVMNRYRSENQ